MPLAIAITLLLTALTAVYFIMVNLEKFIADRRRIDAFSAVWSLILALWFGYAAAWVLIYVHTN